MQSEKNTFTFLNTFFAMSSMVCVVDAIATDAHRNEYAALRQECLFLKGMTLLRFASAPEPSCSFWNNRYWKSDPHTNYFYRTCDDGIGLIVPDLPELRCEAEKLGVSSMVYFGYNTDPVETLRPDKVHDILQRIGGEKR